MFNFTLAPSGRLRQVGQIIQQRMWTSWWREDIDRKKTSLVLITPTKTSALRVSCSEQQLSQPMDHLS